MSSTPCFLFCGDSFRDFDVGVKDDSSSGSDSNHGNHDGEFYSNVGSEKSTAENSLVSTIPTNANHLLLVALLEHVCSLHVRNPRKSSKLFKLLCKQLAALNIMSPLSELDELGPVKMQYKQSFAKLLHSCVSHLKLNSQLALPSPQHNPINTFLNDRLPPWTKPRTDVTGFMSFHTSRYCDEFEQLTVLGKGAYGSVYKVRHKLDGRMYAVKKIAFQDNTPELWSKTLREVKHLADLNHDSIIRYYTAWLEYSIPSYEQRGQRSTDDFNVPAITYSDPDRRDAEISNASQGSSIVFEESSSHAQFSRVDSNSHDKFSHMESNSHAKLSRMMSWEMTNSRSSRYCSLPLKAPSATEARFLQNCHVVLHIQMEICEETLQDYLAARNNYVVNGSERYTHVDVESNRYVLQGVLQGINYIHSNNLIHRDVKPSNIFINHSKSSEGILVKIGDFGLVRTSIENSRTRPSTPMTPNPGLLDEIVLNQNGGYSFLTSGVGTTIYASPEQLAGVDYNTKSDMYSIGLILFELYHPFTTGMERSKLLTDLRRHVLPEDFIDKWPDLTENIMSLIHENPDERPSADELLSRSLPGTKAKRGCSDSVDFLKQELMKKDELLKSAMERINDLERLLLSRDNELMTLKHQFKPILNESGDTEL